MSGAKTGTNGRHPLPDADRFAEFLRAMGANDDSQIVAYDAGGDMYAARFWFLCRWIGHVETTVLDGGFAAWQAAGYETTSERPKRKRGALNAHVNEALIADVREVLEAIESDRLHVVDARSPERFRGENETLDPVGGHIPGARNRHFRENFNADGGLKAPERLRQEFAQLGVTPERVVHQCGSGVSAAVNLLAMEHAGLRDSRVYAGSWSEWSADPKRPLGR